MTLGGTILLLETSHITYCRTKPISVFSPSLCSCCLLTMHLEVCGSVGLLWAGRNGLPPTPNTWDAVTMWTPVIVFFPLRVWLGLKKTKDIKIGKAHWQEVMLLESLYNAG